MEAPACRICGVRAFAHRCTGARPAMRTPALARPVTPVTPVTTVTPDPVTPVTKRPYPVTNVTPHVTPVTETLEQERDRLLARLAEIRAELGSMSAAERQRRARLRGRG